jgi:hypothetical protein
MTNFADKPNPGGLIKLSGMIKNLKVTRSSASFVFTPSDQSKLGILAVANALAGIDGQAATAAHSSNNLEEPADYLEFELDGQPINGWVWRNPFHEGDVVDLAANKVDDHWEAFGVARPSDHMIALYPHCSRGRLAHVHNALKWWALCGGGFIVFLYLPFGIYVAGGLSLTRTFEYQIGAAISLFIFATMTFFLTRQWLPFARIAENVFRALDLPNPSSIDLIKSSKARRKPQDSGEYGTFYFRY